MISNIFNKRYITFIISLIACQMVFAQTFKLKGRVVDEEHNPIELATVSCVEQGKVAMTNLKGEFEITLNSKDSVVVKFSMVGYNARKRTYRNAKGNLSVEVMLPSMA
ncbi:MAG: carboxypeptidase-like regulatory domain-containing protein, partial [Bacteroidaceae bacterium]|nr:carboxypeptidase-like regulatory domain-containing protein [Bacteroidaceae bacterium]